MNLIGLRSYCVACVGCYCRVITRLEVNVTLCWDERLSRARSWFTLMLLVANLANTKWCKKLRNDWNHDVWVLIWEYSARAMQWIQTWQGSDAYQKLLRHCVWAKVVSALEWLKSSLNRVLRSVDLCQMSICHIVRRTWTIHYHDCYERMRISCSGMLSLTQKHKQSNGNRSCEHFLCFSASWLAKKINTFRLYARYIQTLHPALMIQ